MVGVTSNRTEFRTICLYATFTLGLVRRSLPPPASFSGTGALLGRAEQHEPPVGFSCHYGLQALEFSPEALANYHFEVRRLHARMRDGTIVAFEAGEEPDRLDLREAIQEVALVQEQLAVGLQQAFEEKRPFASTWPSPQQSWAAPSADRPGGRRCPLYRATVAVHDENRSGHEEELQFRRLNARLLLSTEDPSGYELLPIARSQAARAMPCTAADRSRVHSPVISVDAWPGPGPTSCGPSMTSSDRNSTS